MPNCTDSQNVIDTGIKIYPHTLAAMLPNRKQVLIVVWFGMTLVVYPQAPAQAKLRIADRVMEYKDDAHYKDYLRWLIVSPDKHNDPVFTGGKMDEIRAKLEDPIRKEIFSRASESKEKFNYETLDDAKRIWQMRLLTISYMQRMTGKEEPKIDFSYYGENRVPKTESKLWERWKPDAPYLKATKGADSFDAINDLVLSGKKTQTECACSVFCCGVAAAATVLGKDDFNKLHPPGTLSVSPEVASKHYYAAVDLETHVPGDRLYMVNSDYTAKMRARMRAGYWHGENAIYLGGGKYSGLGLPGLTEAELRAKLKDAYARDVGEDPPNPERTITWSRNIARPKVK